MHRLIDLRTRAWSGERARHGGVTLVTRMLGLALGATLVMGAGAAYASEAQGEGAFDDAPETVVDVPTDSVNQDAALSSGADVAGELQDDALTGSIDSDVTDEAGTDDGLSSTDIPAGPAASEDQDQSQAQPLPETAVPEGVTEAFDSLPSVEEPLAVEGDGSETPGVSAASNVSDATDVSGAAAATAANSWRFQDGQLIRIPDTVTEASADAVWPAASLATFARSYSAWDKVGDGYVSSNGSLIPGAVSRGIDVSVWDYDIDWDAVVADDIDFAIIRCGHHHYEELEEDANWVCNVSECERLGLPYGIYFYARATTPEEAVEEANFVLRLIDGRSPSLPVYYDMEDSSMIGADLAAVAQAFCGTIAAAGYQPGVYANLWWWTTYLTDPVFESWPRWVAQYDSSCDYQGTYGIWQATSTGTVDGIEGWVDIDFMIDPTAVPGPDDHPALTLFSDVSSQEWYVQRGYLDYVVSEGIMTGMTNEVGEFTGEFKPDDNLLRGQAVTILYRMTFPNSEDTYDPGQFAATSGFLDGNFPAYYNAAIQWATQAGIVTGYEEGPDAGKFKPDDPITRAELAAMVWRYAAYVAGFDVSGADASAFYQTADYDEVFPFAIEPLIWCADNGIITGHEHEDGTLTLESNGLATRAQATKIFATLAQLI